MVIRNKGYYRIKKWQSQKQFITCKPNPIHSNRYWSHLMFWIFLMTYVYIRPDEIPKSEPQDYKTNNSCSASPKIGETATSQVSHMMIATLVIVLVKLLERDQSNRNSFPQFQVQVCLPLWQFLHCCLTC